MSEALTAELAMSPSRPAPEQDFSSLLAVIISFRPSDGLVENVRLLKTQVSELLIVDNTPGSEPSGCLAFLEGQEGIRIIRNGRNLGIASALNLGVGQAIAGGYDWVATFDQDSTVTPGYFAGLAHAYAGCPFQSQVAVLAPVLCPSSKEVGLSMQNHSPKLFSVTQTAMTSGQVIKTEVLKKAGVFDEAFFMDYVDYDFCLRLGQQKYKIIRANGVFLIHKLGLAETHSFLGLTITTKTHNPWRRYYIMRNRVYIYRRYALHFPAWCLWDFIWIFIELSKIIVFERERAAKLRNIWRGLADGFKGKTGQNRLKLP
jgi:rhamnosyltransferase